MNNKNNNKLNNIIITEKMRNEAYFNYQYNLGVTTAIYSLEIDIINQIDDTNYIPLPSEIDEKVLLKAQEINDILYQEYLKMAA